MTKNELLSQMWIPHSKRLPPNDENHIVCWNEERKCITSGLSYVFRTQIEQIKQNPQLLERWKKGNSSSTDMIAISAYFTTHWLYLPPPSKK